MQIQSRQDVPTASGLVSTEGFVGNRISIIVPAFNESDSISRSVDFIEREFSNFLDYEIIVVDDGSTDDTRRTVQDLKNDRVKLVTYDTNRGKGHALKMGFLRVTGQYTFFIDGDLEIRA